MSEPKVFGKFCGLGCDYLGIGTCRAYLDGGIYRVLEADPTTNQIERCSQCLAEYPVEEKEHAD